MNDLINCAMVKKKKDIEDTEQRQSPKKSNGVREHTWEEIL